MSGLLDFFQSASNTVADNVAGPVDLISWGLRKAGVPVGPAPVGGSEWMRQQGLTRPVQQSAASLAGETAGLLAPTMIAAKAPQIAGGLLQMADNAMAPRTLHPQAGAIVWHGSPHKFDKFDSSKIGTGEGAQAYGHGLYLAESPDVALQYSNIRAAPNMDFYAGSRKLSGLEKSIADDITANGKNIARLNAKANGPEWLAAYERIANEPVTRGNVYKVDLPDEAIAKMLDWDKPLSQQAPDVQKAADKLFGKQLEKMLEVQSEYGIKNKFDTYTGEEMYRRLVSDLGVEKFGGQGAAMAAHPDAIRAAGSSVATDALRQQGIPGIRYLDGGSRGTGAGTSNFVIFPGNEDILTILERNGKGLLGQ